MSDDAETLTNARAAMAAMLKNTLWMIEGCDEQEPPDYARRYGLVLLAMGYAHRCGFKVGIAIDAQQPAWPVVYIELPTGQVSWHMPEHEEVWDGHDTATKYERCRAWGPEWTA